MSKLWGGRFRRKTSAQVERFTHSLDVDRRLARQDLLGSIAHAEMLGRSRIIPRSDSRRIVRGLKALLSELDRGRLHLPAGAEDIHTALQAALERKVGQAAQRLHTARSRNDQVVTDLRLYCKERIPKIRSFIRRLQQAILAQAERAGDRVMPGYTHLRHAQPVLIAHLLLSYLEALQRDAARLADGLNRLDELPLGSGALTGTGLAIRRRPVARQLGFSRVAANSMDAVTERDFVAELVSCLALLGVHGSRIAEDLLLWSSAEFGFVVLSERILTGSSMMPQKQNPDFLELVRANAARLVGELCSILTLLKGLPSGYHRDLQLDKEILFGALDRSEAMLVVLAEGFQALRWNPARLEAQLRDESLYATDLAEYLVERGVPFAQAHRSVGRLLAYAEGRGIPIRSLSPSQLRRFSPALGAGALKLLDPSASVRRKRSEGSTRPALVRAAVRRWKRLLRRERA